MRSNQGTQNVINKYAEWLSKGQKEAVKKRAGALSMQNAKTRSGIQTQARQGLRQTNDYLSSMGLASNLRRAPSSGVDRESRRMPEFHQQLQGLRAQEQGQLDAFGRQQAQRTIAARKKAAEEAARKARRRTSGYTVIDPETGKAAIDQTTGKAKVFSSKDEAAKLQGTFNEDYRKEYNVDSTAEIKAITSGGNAPKAGSYEYARLKAGALQTARIEAAKAQVAPLQSDNLYEPAKNMTTESLNKLTTKITSTMSALGKAYSEAMKPATTRVSTGGGADEARQEKIAAIKLNTAKTRVNNVIDYAAEIGAISQASADMFKGRVNDGTFDYEQSGAYLTGRIQQVALNNAGTNAGLMNESITAMIGTGSPTKVQASFREAYAAAVKSGTMEDFQKVGEAYIACIAEQNDAQLQTARDIAVEAIKNGVDGNTAVAAMNAFRAGDTQTFIDLISGGVNDVIMKEIKAKADEYKELGWMTDEERKKIDSAIQSGDPEQARQALVDGVNGHFTRELKNQCREWYEEARKNDSIYKGDDAAAWNRFDSMYRVAQLADTAEAWTACEDAYKELVSAQFNSTVADAKADAEQAVKLGLSQERADEAVKAYRNGDVETYLKILDETGFEDRPIGYVAALEKDTVLRENCGIDYATYSRYANATDAEIDATIRIYENAIGQGDFSDEDYEKRNDLESVRDFRMQLANGMNWKNAKNFTEVSDEAIEKYGHMSVEQLDAEIENLNGGGKRRADIEERIEQLKGVKTARTIDRNTDKLKEYESMTDEKLTEAIETLKTNIEGANSWENGVTTWHTTPEQLEAWKSELAIAGYAQSKNRQAQRAETLDSISTKTIERLRKENNFDIVAAGATTEGSPNEQAFYKNGKWYWKPDDDDARESELAPGASERVKITGRKEVPAERYDELGWSGVTADSYLNAQVVKREDGKYVVMSTVTNSGVPMSASWAMKYGERLSKVNGTDPDGLTLGVFDSKDAADAYVYDVEEIANGYREGNGDEIDSETAKALMVLDILKDEKKIAASKMTDADAIDIGNDVAGDKDALKAYKELGAYRQAGAASEAILWDKYASADEKKLLAYYCATDLEQANDYLGQMRTYLNERASDELQEMAELASGTEIRDENGKVIAKSNAGVAIASHVATYMIQPMTAMGGLYTLWQTVTGNDIDPYSEWFSFNTWNSTVRGTQYEAIQRHYDEKYGKKEGKSFLGKATVQAMSTMDSIVDSWIGAYLGQGIAAGTAGQAFTLSMMGMSAAGQTAQELTQKGVPQEQAKKLGVFAGIFEALFEVVSLENIIHGADDLTKGWAKRMAIGGFLEGSEELFTSAANLAANVWTLKESSDYQTEIAEMMTNGKSYANAAALATWNQASGVLMDGFGGFLSGGFTGTANAIRADINAKQTGKAIKKAGLLSGMIDAAKTSLSERTQSYWSTIEAAYGTNANLSDLDVGRLNYALAMGDLETLTSKVDGLVEEGTIKEKDGKAIKEYLTGLYTASAHGKAATAFGIDLNTEALNGVDHAAIETVSAAAFEMTGERAEAVKAARAENTTTAALGTDAARTEKRSAMNAENAREVLEANVTGTQNVNGVQFVSHTENKASKTDLNKVKLAAAMAKVSGTEIVVHDTLPTNGVMVDGVLHVALDSDRGFVGTVAHELTHWMKSQSDAESYNKLVDFLRQRTDAARKNGFEELVGRKAEEYRELYPNATEEQIRSVAEDEAVASLCENMLNDEAFVRDLMQKDATLFEKIYNWINEVLDSFREILASDKELRNGRNDADRVLQDIDSIERARDLWYEVMKSAKNGTQTQEQGQAQFSKRAVDIGEATEREKEIAQELLEKLEITKQKAEEGKNGHNKNGVGYWSDSDLRSYFKENADADLVTLYMSSEEGKQSAQRIVKEIIALVDDQDILSKYKSYLTQTNNEPHFTFDQVLHGERDAYRKNAGAAKRAIGMMFGQSAKESGKQNIVGHKVTIRKGGISVTEMRSLFNELAVNVDDEMKTLADKGFKGEEAYRIEGGPVQTQTEPTQTEQKTVGQAEVPVYDLRTETDEQKEFGYSDRDLRDELYDVWGNRQRPSDETYEQAYERNLDEWRQRVGMREYKTLIDDIEKEYGSIEEYAKYLAERDVRENEEVLRRWKPFEARANELVEQGLGEREAAEQAYRETVENKTEADTEQTGEVVTEEGTTEETGRTVGPGNVPVYDLRQRAEQRLEDAEEAEQTAIAKYGENSEEAEAAAKTADEAFEELERVTTEADAEAQRQTEEDADTLRALDEEAERKAEQAEAKAREEAANRDAKYLNELDRREEQRRFDEKQDDLRRRRAEARAARAKEAFDEARDRIRIERSQGDGPRTSTMARDEAQPDLEGAKAATANVINADGSETISKDIEDIARNVKKVHGFGLLDPARMMDRLAKGNTELRAKLKKILEDPFNEAGKKYAVQLNARRSAFDSEMQRLGITTRELSAAVQKYGEGGYVDEFGDWQSYTDKDLEAEFPEMAAKIKEAADVCRNVYDDYIDDLNEMLERIYPNVIDHAETKHEKLQEYVNRAEGRVTEQNRLINEIKEDLKRQYAQLEGKKRTDTQAYANLVSSIAANEQRLENAQTLKEIYQSRVATRKMQMNEIETAVANGEEIRGRRVLRRADYFHHFQTHEDGFARLREILSNDADISPELAGKTAETMPKSKWAGFMQRRTGEKTEIDAIKGMHLYMMEAERKLAFDPFTAHLQDFENKLRRAGADIDENAGPGLQDTQDMARWLKAWRNQIAGKSNEIDRAISDGGIVGRKAIEAFKWINSRVRSNAVLGNIHSALVQVSNLTNASTYIRNPKDWAEGARYWIQHQKGTNETVENVLAQSGFMTQRYGLDFDEYDHKAGVKDAALWMLGAGDKAAGELMWFAAYAKYMRDPAAAQKLGNGHYRNAIEYADDITRRSTGGRGIGESATLMGSQFLNLLAPFQLEVNNTFQNLREMVGQKAAGRLIAFELTTSLLNAGLQAVMGDKPLPFDLIDAIISAFKHGDDDDDDEERTVGETVKLLGQSLGGTLVNGIPFASQLFGTFLGADTADEIFGEDYSPTMYGTGNIGLTAVADSLKGGFKFAKNALTGNYDTVDEWTAGLLDNSDWMKLVMPWGGAQLQRTLKGADMLAKGYSAKLNNEGELEAQFGYEHGFFKDLRALTLGKWATPEADAYLNGETRKLNAEQTAMMQEAQRSGMKPIDFFEGLAKLKEQSATKDADGNTVVTKASAQMSALADDETMSGEQKKILLDAIGGTNAMRDRYEADGSGIKIDTFLDYAADYGDKTDLNEDETANTAFLMRVAGDKTLTDGQKIAMTNIVLGTNGKKKAERMQNAMDAGVDVEKFLTFDLMTGKKEEKMDALMADASLTAEQKGSIAKLMYPEGKERDWTSAAMYELSGMGDNEYSKAKVAIAKGVPAEKAVEYYNAAKEKQTDASTGNTTSVGKDALLERLMNDRSLTPAQKTTVETMLYPTTAAEKRRDYSNADWFYLSSTSSGMSGKAYKYAKIAVAHGIPLEACVKETKEYNRRSETKSGHGSSGGCTQKDTKEIVKSLGLSNKDASMMLKIYTGKVKE